jgi:hypothetical protein
MDLGLIDRVKVDPVYRWPYRPEMQFSVYDLNVKAINKINTDGNVIDIMDAKTPGFGTSQKALVSYDLFGNQYGILDPFGDYNTQLVSVDPENKTGRELVFALGAEEALAYMGGSQTATFENLEHLSNLASEDFLTLSFYQNTDAGNVLWEFAFVAPIADRIREADNKCNAAPNRKQKEFGSGDTLIIAFEPEIPNQATVLLDEVSMDGLIDNVGYIVRGPNNNWMDTFVEKDLLNREVKITFKLEDTDKDERYEIHYFMDENLNRRYDNGEVVNPMSFRRGKLDLLAASSKAYDKHEADLPFWVSSIGGSTGSAYDLYTYFVTGAPNPTNIHPLVYRQERQTVVGDPNSSVDDTFVDSWVHGAGEELAWTKTQDGKESCDALVPKYEHSEGTKLYTKVMESTQVVEALQQIVFFASFANDRSNSTPCSVGDCVQFNTASRDNDIVYSAFAIPQTNAADLAAAIGSAKYRYNAQVRFSEGIFEDSYDIKLNGVVYDFYDFDYGKTTAALLYFNNDGALLELGYEMGTAYSGDGKQAGRQVGNVFITEVPFEVHFNLQCDVIDKLAGGTSWYNTSCDFLPTLQFSDPGDFL